jgi:hypothetical protein
LERFLIGKKLLFFYLPHKYEKACIGLA